MKQIFRINYGVRQFELQMIYGTAYLQNLSTYIHKPKRGKLDNRAEKGIFLGYDNRPRAYRIFTNDGRVILARTVKFAENNMGNSNANENPDTNKLMSEINKQTQQNEINVIEFDMTPEKRCFRYTIRIPTDTNFEGLKDTIEEYHRTGLLMQSGTVQYMKKQVFINMKPF